MTGSLDIKAGTVSGGILAGSGMIEGEGFISNVTIAAGTTCTSSEVSLDGVTVHGALIGSGVAGVDFIRSGT